MTTENDKQLPLFDIELPKPDKKKTSEVEKTPPSQFSPFIIYVDESGDHSLQSVDSQYPVFVLAFCVFHKRYYAESIVPALEKFKFNHFGHDQVVLHENEIRKEKGAFNIFRSREEQFQFLGQLTEIIENSNFVLISSTIDKQALQKRNEVEANPYHVALAVCMESLYEFLKEKYQHEKPTHIIVECRGKKEDKDLELEFRRVCDGKNRLGIPLPFEVIFSDKRAMSSGLQLADLVARPIGLHHIRPRQNNRAFEVLKEKFYCAGGRKNLGVDFEGVGMNIYPTPKSEKPR